MRKPTSEQLNEMLEIFGSIIQEYGIELKAEEYDALDIPNKPARTTIRRYWGGWRKCKGLSVSNDDEIVAFNVRLAKQTQKFRDISRIERKSFREHARIENSVAELNVELINLLKQNNLSKFTIKHDDTNKQKAVGIVHLSDPHFNELVELSINTYDFPIASKRCRKYIQQAKRYFGLFGIGNVLFAMTGDLLNSDRRLSELLSQATNRSKAMFLGTQIIQQMLLDLNMDFDVSVACVTGNESRISKDVGWVDSVASDNYDFSIYHILKYIFTDSDGITFIDSDNPHEQVINVANQNVLLIHGNQISDNVEQAVQKIKGKYVSRGINVDFVIFGDKHSCRIGDQYARSSSMVGANAYSDSALQLASRASQNIHMLFSDGSRDGVKIDLQNIEGIEGYDINKTLESYNAKSASKAHKPITIFKVTI